MLLTLRASHSSHVVRLQESNEGEHVPSGQRVMPSTDCQWSIYVGPHRPPTPRDVEDRAPEGPFAFVCLSPIVWLPAHTHDDVAKERKRKAGNEGWLGAMPCHVTSCHHRIASQQQLDLRGGGKDVVVVERRLRLGGRRLCRDARASREHEGRAKCKCNCKAGQGRAGQGS